MMVEAASPPAVSGVRAGHTRRIHVRSLWPGLWPTLGGAAFLLALEVLPRIGIMPSHATPPLSEAVPALMANLSTNAGMYALQVTATSMGVALLISVGIAIPAGLAIGLSEWAYRAVRQTVELMRAIPGIVLLPVALLLLGPTVEMAIFFAAFAGFWPLLYQAYSGVRNIEPTLFEVAKVYRIGRWSQFTRIVLPGALPYIATGLRLAATSVLLVIVGVQLVGGVIGVGNTIDVASQNNNYPLMYGTILLVGLLGLIVNLALRRLERLTLHWHASQRGHS